VKTLDDFGGARTIEPLVRRVFPCRWMCMTLDGVGSRG
jgi:hypothetical protein